MIIAAPLAQRTVHNQHVDTAGEFDALLGLAVDFMKQCLSLDSAFHKPQPQSKNADRIPAKGNSDIANGLALFELKSNLTVYSALQTSK